MLLIDIPKPCSENWNSMNTAEKGRFCENCQKKVIDLEQLSNLEILQLSMQQPKGLCGRITKTKLQAINKPVIRKSAEQPFLPHHLHTKTMEVKKHLWLQQAKKIGFATLSLALVNCTQVDTTTQTNKIVSNQQQIQFPVKEKQATPIDEDIMGDIISRYPIYYSPLEVLNALKKIDSQKQNFKGALLCKIVPITDSHTQNELMLLYGIYAVDMYYAALYQKKELAMNYLQQLEEIEGRLGLDKKVKMRNDLKFLLEKGANLEDTVLNIAVENIWAFQEYCDESKSPQLSGLLSTMGFLEATYLTSLYYQETNNLILRNELAMQKIVVALILDEFEMFKTENLPLNLVKDFKNLAKSFDLVNVKVIYNKPIIIQKGDEVEVEANNTYNITVSDKDFDTVIAAIQEIRNKYVRQ